MPLCDSEPWSAGRCGRRLVLVCLLSCCGLLPAHWLSYPLGPKLVVFPSSLMPALEITCAGEDLQALILHRTRSQECLNMLIIERL